MKAHEQDRCADQDFINQLDKLQHLVMKNFRFRGFGFGPFQHAGHLQIIQITTVAAGQHLGFGPIRVNPAGGELSRGPGMTGLHTSLVAAGLDAV